MSIYRVVRPGGVPGGSREGVPRVSYDPRTRPECERARTNATSASSYSHPYTFSYRRLYTLQNRCTSCIHLSLSARTSVQSTPILGYLIEFSGRRRRRLHKQRVGGIGRQALAISPNGAPREPPFGGKTFIKPLKSRSLELRFGLPYLTLEN